MYEATDMRSHNRVALKVLRIHRQEKFELEKKLKQAQVTEKSSNAATKQLRHYLLLYKQKADEKQTLTEETLAQQESLIKVGFVLDLFHFVFYNVTCCRHLSLRL